MKKIKKYFPLIIGLVLLLSVAAYGTRAYFTDSTREDAGIKLTLGKVEIKSESKNWIYNNVGKYDDQLKDTTAGKKVLNKEGKIIGTEFSKKENITNVKPGDSFSKKFTFKNNSTMKVAFSFKENVSSNIKNPFIVTYEIDDTKYLTPHVLNGNESVDVTMTIKVKEDNTENIFNSGNEEKFLANSNVIDLMEKGIEVQLEQAK